MIQTNLEVRQGRKNGSPSVETGAVSLTRFRGQVRGSDTGYLVGLVFKVHR